MFLSAEPPSSATLDLKALLSPEVVFSAGHFSSVTQILFSLVSGSTQPERCSFAAVTGFEAIRSDRGFNMAGTEFATVPNFIQAHFEEAPRLDNLRVVSRIFDRRDRAAQENPQQPEAKSQPKKLKTRAIDWIMKSRRWAEGTDHDTPAHWRALKKLAIQGHDTSRTGILCAGDTLAALWQ